jgi:hypothetical protein
MKTENLTTKEQAEKLVRKYYTFGLNNTAQSFSWYECKECALIAVDEIIKECCKSSEKKDAKYQDERINYWQQVKHEIEIL